MAYARFSDDSDVYVYISYKSLECCNCSLNGSYSYSTYSTKQMILHLNEHLLCDQKVPSHTIESLLKDEQRNDSTLKTQYINRLFINTIKNVVDNTPVTRNSS